MTEEDKIFVLGAILGARILIDTAIERMNSRGEYSPLLATQIQFYLDDFYDYVQNIEEIDRDDDI